MRKPDNVFAQKIYKKFFKGRTHGVLIECGANDGYSGSIGHWFEHQHSWRCINIEPNPHCTPLLKKNRRHCVNLNVALSHQEGEAMFNYPVDGPRKEIAGQGSLSKCRLEEWENRDVRSVRVETVRYDLLVGRLLFSAVEPYFTQVDLMILDVEGHEMTAIEGMTGSQNLPLVLVVETDKTSARDVLNKIKPWGYEKSGDYRGNTFFIRR